MAEMKVTPWEVRGHVDYNKLIKEFGTSKIDDKLLKRLQKHTKDIHMFLRRGFFFSHRDFDKILDQYEKGEKFVLYTGRGPSGHTHIGHLMPYFFTKWLQDEFDAEVYFQMTDDEKFLFKPKLTIEQVQGYMQDNILDVIAAGFDEKKTHIISDINNIKSLYKISLEVAKRTTFSTAKAVFGFNNQSNMGMLFFPMVQASPAFLPSVLKKRKMQCLIPSAIDQDPYWRVARDVAPKIGMPKPAAIHCKFISGLGPGEKMSASEPETCIFVTDNEQDVKRKVLNAFTGGAATLAEQKKKGGNPEVCSVYNYLYYFFEANDKKAEALKGECKRGSITCGQCKATLANYINSFLKEHQKKREKAKSKVDKFMFKDPV